MSFAAPTKSIVDLMRGLWTRFFPLPSFRPWLACAAAMHGLSYGLSAEDQQLIADCMALPLDQLPTTPANRIVVIAGRRGGKGRFVSALAVEAACFRDYSTILAPGERGVVMIVAPDRRQCRVVFRYILALLEQTPMLAGLIENTTKDSIDLTNRISIEVHTASYRSVRGYTCVAAVVEESAFLPTDDSAEPDSELLSALLPAMASVPGSFLAMISSPYAKRGELWKAFAKHYGKPDAPVRVWKASTRTMNPTIDPRVIEEAYADDPAKADAEYGANFRNDVELLVPEGVLAEVTMKGCALLKPSPTATHGAFVDPSGGTSDEFPLAIAHVQEDGTAVLDGLWVATPPFNPDQVVAMFADILRSYRVSEVTGDAYAGEWPRERFRAHGIDYRVSDRTKTQIYQSCLPLLNSGRVKLLDEARMLKQFAQLERRQARGGREIIDHPPGSKDDRANAAAGALVAVHQAATNGAAVGTAYVHWI